MGQGGISPEKRNAGGSGQKPPDVRGRACTAQAGREHVLRPSPVSSIGGLKLGSDMVQLVIENDLSVGPESPSQGGSLARVGSLD